MECDYAVGRAMSSSVLECPAGRVDLVLKEKGCTDIRIDVKGLIFQNRGILLPIIYKPSSFILSVSQNIRQTALSNVDMHILYYLLVVKILVISDEILVILS
jgi:hypothetical protein